ncbi:autotransporter outer membrane beta-barrel domain-containing protein, partial [Ruegeria marina]
IPPTGVTPELPVGVTPPIGTIPPTGVTPEVPVSPSRPVIVAPVERSEKASQTSAARPDDQCTSPPNGKLDERICDPFVAHPSSYLGTPPLTTGRALEAPREWNIWTQVSSLGSQDDRGRFSSDSNSWFLGVGVDKLVSTNAVVGIQLELDRSEITGLNGAFTRDSTGFSIGPYFSTLIHENWALGGLLSFGRVSTDFSLAGLEGEFDQSRFSASLSLDGQYQWENFLLRPSLQAVYSYVDGAQFNLAGNVGSVPVVIPTDVPSYSVLSIVPKIEISRPFINGGTIYEPFAEFGGVSARTNGSIPITGHSVYSDGSFNGTIKLGIRGRNSDSLFFEFELGYLSGFESNLDVFEVSAFLSYSF